MTPDQQKTVKKWMPLAKRITRQIGNRLPEAQLDDLTAEAYLLLCNAVVAAGDRGVNARYIWKSLIYRLSGLRSTYSRVVDVPRHLVSASTRGGLEDIDEDTIREKLPEGTHPNIIRGLLSALGNQIADGVDKIIDESTESPEDTVILMDQIEALPDEDQRLLMAKIFEGRTFAEIAETEGVSRAAIQWRFKKVIAKMRRDA